MSVSLPSFEECTSSDFKFKSPWNLVGPFVKNPENSELLEIMGKQPRAQQDLKRLTLTQKYQTKQSLNRLAAATKGHPFGDLVENIINNFDGKGIGSDLMAIIKYIADPKRQVQFLPADIVDEIAENRDKSELEKQAIIKEIIMHLERTLKPLLEAYRVVNNVPLKPKKHTEEGRFWGYKSTDYNPLNLPPGQNYHIGTLNSNGTLNIKSRYDSHVRIDLDGVSIADLLKAVSRQKPKLYICTRSKPDGGYHFTIPDIKPEHFPQLEKAIEEERDKRLKQLASVTDGKGGPDTLRKKRKRPSELKKDGIEEQSPSLRKPAPRLY